MKATPTKIPGCTIYNVGCFEDQRGLFIKPFNFTRFAQVGLPTQFKEDFYTISKKNVLRGLHFQIPPHHNAKLVSCSHGSIFDVVVDLRPNSPTFQQHITFQLRGKTGDVIFIPAGCAHGFLSLEDNSIVCYKVTSEHDQASDSGIHWDSAGIAWPSRENLIISERDSALVPMSEFKSTF